MKRKGRKSRMPDLELITRRQSELLDVPAALSLDEMAAALGKAKQERRRVMLLIALAKGRFFKGEYRKWLDWARESSGLDKGMCDRYARVGSWLVGQVDQYPILAQVWDCLIFEELTKLAPGELGHFLYKHREDLPGMNRTEVRGLVKIIIGASQDAPAAETATEPERTPDANPVTLFRWAKQYAQQMAAYLDQNPHLMPVTDLQGAREHFEQMMDACDEALLAHGVVPAEREQFAARLARAQAAAAAQQTAVRPAVRRPEPPAPLAFAQAVNA